MRTYGKSNRSKERRRWQRELAAYWKASPISYCEARLSGCVGSFGLSPAHSKKRRFIRTKEDYFEVVAACQNCHQQLDQKMSHTEMEAKVKEIINARQHQFI